MKEILENEVYFKSTEYIRKIKEILDDYFGEEYVSIPVLEEDSDEYFPKIIRNCNYTTAEEILGGVNRAFDVIIYYPKVTVTNEYNHSVDITDVYIGLEIDILGQLETTFTLLRTSYTSDQLNVGYCHSHVPRVNPDNIFNWHHPCLGNGPIKNTITSLIKGFDEELWKLFCVELNSYIHTESISGGPYIRLSSVGGASYSSLTPVIFDSNSSNICGSVFPNRIIIEFIKYFIKNNTIKFNYTDSHYGLGYSNRDKAVILSYEFMKFFTENNELFISDRQGFDIEKCIESELLYKIYMNENSEICTNYSTLPTAENYQSLNNQNVLKFKNQWVKSNLIINTKSESNFVGYLLSMNNIQRIEKLISIIIDYGYKENRSNQTSKILALV